MACHISVESEFLFKNHLATIPSLDKTVASYPAEGGALF